MYLKWNIWDFFFVCFKHKIQNEGHSHLKKEAYLKHFCFSLYGFLILFQNQIFPPSKQLTGTDRNMQINFD